MALESFYREIRRFLESKDAEVLVVAGKWGVGKTFAWNKLLIEARDRGSIGLEKYAYVSLFGLTTLDDVKGAIFQNTVAKGRAGVPADMSTLDGVVKAATSSWRSGMGIARFIPLTADYSAALEKIGFFSVKHQIVCIDDLERRSQELDMRDVLGLVSFLKEQRSCKVVILLNDERLGGDEDEFRSQLEKVADVAVRFAPTSSEAAEIGLAPDAPLRPQLVRDCTTLGIVNIRTIKKIERMARRLKDELAGYDPRVLEQAVHSAALFIFAKHQPDDAPSLDFIRTYNRFKGLFGEEGKEQPHAEWRAALQEFEFTSLDQFDLVVLSGVEKGHFDSEQLQLEGRKLETQLRQSDDDRSFSEAWDLYHDSFANNADEIMDQLAAAVQSMPKSISPTNLSGTITLLKELGWTGNIDDLIKSYVNARDEPREFWDLSESTFGDEVKDLNVREAFAAKVASFQKTRDLPDTLVRVGTHRSWNPEDLAFLAEQSPEAFYDVFKNLAGEQLRRAIRGALMFQDLGNADGKMQALTQHAVSALQRIGLESAINRRRVLQKGVEVPDNANADDGAAE